MENLTGKQFGQYQIVAPLGAGGMAAVYKAHQPAMERFVALKVLPRHMTSSEEFLGRFRREARLLAQLQHPHILPVFDYGKSEGYPYIVMPFIMGGTLAQILRRQRLSLPEVRRVTTQVGEALSYAHERGMIHRDIKPSNVLIDERGNCLLTDFGLARMAEAAENLTTSGSVMGTPAYMSPEQARGAAADHRSDLYSLGIVLYEMVTGRVPYVAETPIAVVYKQVYDPLPSARNLNPDLPEALELVLLKSLAKDPADRYQTADEFVQALQNAIPESGAADPTLPPKPLPAMGTTAEPQDDIEKQPIFEFQAIPPAAGIPNPEQAAGERRAPRALPPWTLAGIGILGLALVLLAVRNWRSTPTTPASTSPVPTVAATAAPVSSATPASATSLPTLTPQAELPAEVSFRDDFETQLGEGWTWEAEDPARWSLSEVPGWLQILASDASFDGPSFPTNVLLREPPAGDFEMTTRVEFHPTTNFQVAGLLVFQDKSNLLQYGRGFCDLPDVCAGGGIYFDNFENGSITGSSRMISTDAPQVYLRLRREGATYTAYYSEDGENWTLLGEHVRDFSEPRIGLVAAQASEPIPAQFDFFSLTSLGE